MSHKATNPSFHSNMYYHPKGCGPGTSKQHSVTGELVGSEPLGPHPGPWIHSLIQVWEVLIQKWVKPMERKGGPGFNEEVKCWMLRHKAGKCGNSFWWTHFLSETEIQQGAKEIQSAFIFLKKIMFFFFVVVDKIPSFQKKIKNLSWPHFLGTVLTRVHSSLSLSLGSFFPKDFF